ncbi:GyrI-like domain-containing protein [Gemmatimonas sp.]|uniref:GyrI-like domain-containing protein n=1 Tax=Gemmatimonas sp. TaxID=1962908 RepID=UPI00391D744D
MTDPRFEPCSAMLLAGIRCHHDLQAAPQQVPAQWEAFHATPLRQTQAVTYGVTCSFDAATQRLEYMCAVEVSSFDEVPEGTGRLRVPDMLCAVFPHVGPPHDIPATWGRAMHWLASNGRWEDAHMPNFERYDERMQCEIWLPVRESRVQG